MCKKALSKVLYIPLYTLAITNLLFLLLIQIIRLIGKGLVWINNKISEAGDYIETKIRGRTVSEKVELIKQRIIEKRK